MMPATEDRKYCSAIFAGACVASGVAAAVPATLMAVSVEEGQYDSES